MNLFASPNNNAVILPGKCVSCLMPLYAFFCTTPERSLIYLQIDFAEVGSEERENPFISFDFDYLDGLNPQQVGNHGLPESRQSKP